MNRIFKNGELQEVILNLLERDQPLNGYAIMQKLAAELRGSWRPSPGSIYPALLGLEDARMIRATEIDGTKMYELEESGKEIAENSTVLDNIKERTSRDFSSMTTVGELITEFLRNTPFRRFRLNNEEKQLVENLLENLNRSLSDILKSKHKKDTNLIKKVGNQSG